MRLPAVWAGLGALRTGVAQVFLQVSPLQHHHAAWVGALQLLVLTQPQVVLQETEGSEISCGFLGLDLSIYQDSRGILSSLCAVLSLV